MVPGRMHPWAALLGAPLLLACGEGPAGGQAKSIAAAFEKQGDPAAEARQAGEDMRRLKQKVEADRAQAIEADIDKAATVPETLPADITAGCAEMRAAYDGFVKQRVQGDAVEAEKWAVTKGVDLDPAQAHCLATDNLRFAACQARAFREATPGVARERAQALIDACARKTGAPTGAEREAAERVRKTPRPS